MHDATEQKISKAINDLLDNNDKRLHVIKGCKETKQLLGATHCVEVVAKVLKRELIGE